MREERRAFAAERADLLEGRGAPADDREELPALPNPVDDPEGYARAAQAREDALRAELRGVRDQVANLQGRTDKIGGEIDAKVSGSGVYSRVIAHNERLLERYAEQKGLSEADVERVKLYLNPLRIENEGFGEWVRTADGRTLWQFTPEAVERADWSARPDAHRQSLSDEAYERAATDVTRSHRADRPFTFGENGVPAVDASIEEQAAYYYSLPEQSPLAQRFMDGLPLDRVKAIVEFRIEEEASELGEVPTGNNPLGVEAVETHF